MNKLSICLILIAFCSPCLAGGEDLLSHGRVYLDSDLCMSQCNATEAEKFKDCSDKRALAEKKILNFQIDEESIEKKYLSKATVETEVLPILFTKKVQSEPVLLKVLNGYAKSDDFWFKFYAWRYVNVVDSEIISRYSDAIKRLFAHEIDENLKSMILYSLFKFRADVSENIAVDIAENGSDNFKKSLCATLYSAKEEGKNLDSMLDVLGRSESFMTMCPL